jgi:uncharacterized protein
MRMNLSELEIRVLGALMEKELTTPENYPLSLNALVSACNQKSNRDPVLSLTEPEVQRILETLGARGLARLTTTGGRVAKYVHSVTSKLGLAEPARAVLAELMLRGPQTVGELRTRAERMAAFPNVGAVEEVLSELRRHGPPLVAQLPRQAGRKEARWAQLLAGMPEVVEEEAAGERADTGDEAAAPAARGESPAAKVARLEEEAAALRGDISELRREIEEFIADFS